MEEIKTELRQDNLAVKANAVAKLTYVSIWLTFNLSCKLEPPLHWGHFSSGNKGLRWEAEKGENGFEK